MPLKACISRKPLLQAPLGPVTSPPGWERHSVVTFVAPLVSLSLGCCESLRAHRALGATCRVGIHNCHPRGLGHSTKLPSPACLPRNPPTGTPQGSSSQRTHSPAHTPAHMSKPLRICPGLCGQHPPEALPAPGPLRSPVQPGETKTPLQRQSSETWPRLSSTSDDSK